MKTFTLAVSAFHSSYFGEIHPFGYPAFRAVGKRGGFYKYRPYAELPAMNAEPAVLNRLFFIRQALQPAFYHRQDPILFVSRTNVSCNILLSRFDIILVNDDQLSVK